MTQSLMTAVACLNDNTSTVQLNYEVNKERELELPVFSILMPGAGGFVGDHTGVDSGDVSFAEQSEDQGEGCYSYIDYCVVVFMRYDIAYVMRVCVCESLVLNLLITDSLPTIHRSLLHSYT
jgi:hypothetical protein